MTTESYDENSITIYTNTRKDLLERDLSNSERYDNAILTLSTGLLGISLAFIKDIVPLEKVKDINMLIASWCFFGAAIFSTILSFIVSQQAIKCQLKYAEEYYLNKKEEYIEKKNLSALLTEYINYCSGILFILGIIFTIFFVSINIKGAGIMNKKTIIPVTEGANVHNMQPITTQKGATIPNMQPIKPAPPKTQPSTDKPSK